MSALDDLIARDAGGSQQGGLDALIARDMGGASAPSAASAPPAAPQAAPAQPMTMWGSIAKGISDPLNAGAQMLAHAVPDSVTNAVNSATQYVNGLPVIGPVTKALGMTPATPAQLDSSIAQGEQAYQARRQAAGDSGFDGWRMAGNIVGTAPLAMLAPSAAPASLAGRAAMGAATGGAMGSLTPVTDPTEQQNFWGEKGAQSALGAVTGGILSPAATMASRVISPNIDPAVQRLIDAGVTPTPGQIMGGAWARTEEKLTSVPFLGDMIKNGQRRAVDQFNRATYDDALGPIGQTLPNNVALGSDAVGAVRNRIGAVYDSLQPRASFAADQQFGADLAGIRAELAQNAPGVLGQFDNIVQHQITGKLNNGAMTGQQWGATRTTLGQIGRQRVMGNASPDDRALSAALGDLNDAVTGSVGRNSPPDILPTLNQANSAWSRFKQIESAAGSTGASNAGNVFTPAQYAAAIRRGSTMAQKSQNSGLNAGFAADAQQVLGSKYPDSGTPGRGLLTLALGAAGGHAMAPAAVIPAATAVGIGALPYTQIGQNVAARLLTQRPTWAQPIAGLLNQAAPALGAAGATQAPSLLNLLAR